MKQVSILLFFFFTATLTNAQTAKDQQQFLTWFFAKRTQSSQTNYYLTGSDSSTVAQLKEYLQGDTISDRTGMIHRGTNPNTLSLTKKERKYVNKQVQKLYKQHLPDHLVPGSRLITQDMINFYLKDRGYGWTNLFKRGVHGYYAITKPIFLRKGTLCIFQYSYNCGPLCGQGASSVYKKVNGKWEEWIQFSNWIS